MEFDQQLPVVNGPFGRARRGTDEKDKGALRIFNKPMARRPQLRELNLPLVPGPNFRRQKNKEAWEAPGSPLHSSGEGC